MDTWPKTIRKPLKAMVPLKINLTIVSFQIIYHCFSISLSLYFSINCDCEFVAIIQIQYSQFLQCLFQFSQYFFNWLDGPNIWLFLDNHDIIVEPRTVCGDFSLRSGPRAAETWSDSLSSPSLHICRHVQCAMCNVHPPFTILSWDIHNNQKFTKTIPTCSKFWMFL